MIALDPDRIVRGGRVPDWIRLFAAEPDAAVADLLVGGASLGAVVAAEPVAVLLGWLRNLEDEEFAAAVDAAVERWIIRSWRRPYLADAPRSASLTSLAWCRVGDLVAGVRSLGRAARALRDRLPEDRRFLRALVEGRSRDPEARCWLAIARYQKDRTLLDWWWSVCNLPPDVPWYFGLCGIHGLRGLPPEDPQRGGTFPSEVAEGLARLGDGLALRAAEGWFREAATARDEFLRVARLSMAAYPLPDRWLSFWRHAVQTGRKNQTVQEWIQSLFPRQSLRPGRTRRHSRRTPWAEADPSWPELARSLAARLRQGEWKALPEAERLLTEQVIHAQSTGNRYFAVRTACNFAASVREARPELALAWSRQAKRLDPWNAYAWTTETATLLTLGRSPEALANGLEAVTRFPGDAVARNGLAEVLRASGRLEESERLYRETVTRFPGDAVARSGLAEVLRASGRLEASERLYRETVARFPGNVFARTGLAGVLRALGRLEESERSYRETVTRFPDNVVARNGLAEVLRASGRLEESERLYRETVTRFPDNTMARKGLESVVRLREARGEEISYESVPESAGEVREPMPEGDWPRGDPIKPKEEGEEVVEPPSDTPTDVRFRPSDVQHLLQSAYLLRRWGRSRSESSEAAVSLRGRAQDLLERLTAGAEQDSAAAGELGLLTLGDDDLRSAVELLREAVYRFPGSARVAYALARAERELASRESPRLEAEQVALVERPWQRLVHVDERLRPLALLGAGRAWLGRLDGARVEEGARHSLGQFGYWVRGVRQSLEDADRPLADALQPAHWWAAQVEEQLFGGRAAAGYDAVGDIEPLRTRSVEHGPALDDLEADWVWRIAQA